jgi:hypothetical protein
MSQAADLKGFFWLVRRYRGLVSLFAGLGIIGGAVFAVLHPPLRESRALVVLPAAGQVIGSAPARSIQTQAVIASSGPVLGAALPKIRPPISMATLRNRLQISTVTPEILEISAKGTTAAQAEATANAVADSYLIISAIPSEPDGLLLERATTAAGTPWLTRLLTCCGIGLMVGWLVGAITAVAVGGSNKKLRERDEIANAIGIPVLASLSVAHPSDAAGWAKLLGSYQPGAMHAWGMRKALHQLGLTSARKGSGASLAVLSLSGDPGAIALGPQLAVFAASLGISTALIIGSQHRTGTTAVLRAACARPLPPAAGAGHLQITVEGTEDSDPAPVAALTIVVTVADLQGPRMTSAISTTATVLGVSAGAVTAEQLARAAASAADDGRDIVGILVADPDPADNTTGRLPQPARRRPPTRLAMMTETRL